jgi:hypothetical protein
MQLRTRERASGANYEVSSDSEEEKYAVVEPSPDNTRGKVKLATSAVAEQAAAGPRTPFKKLSSFDN